MSDKEKDEVAQLRKAYDDLAALVQTLAPGSVEYIKAMAQKKAAYQAWLVEATRK